jgi:hypothetical protein
MLIYRHHRGIADVPAASPQAVRNEKSGGAPALAGYRGWLRLAAASAALPLVTLVAAGGARAGVGPAAAAVTGTRASLTAVAAIAGSTGAWAVGETCPKGPEGCVPGNDLVLRDSGGGWSAVSAPSPGGQAGLVAVAADSSSDAWAVGSYDGGEKNLYLHWKGTAWKRVTGPGNSTLTGVAAISPTDALAVGYGTSSTGATVTVALHWNGTSWARVPTPDPGGAGDDELFGVTAIPGTADAWAVGYNLTKSSESQTLVLHWNGSAWSQASAPAVATDGTQLNAVTAVSANDAWAVGQYNTASDFEHPVILHWDGTTWSKQKLPSFGQSVYVLHSVAAAASDVWAVGLGPCLGQSIDCPSKALTMHLTGSGWQVVPGVSISDRQDQNNLAGVAITPGGTTWAVGDYFPAAYGEPIFALLEKQHGSGWVTR